ncbi:unnamed protein product [Protopolystoma xenopodis]|uniref:Uncharacterized protein n=1 Tax=Protopolystoma xenopodis TaxID=117903 RepID=A0A3S5ADU4_9PLAT|nr:unnamed protein product [Protopolystoma xenopodis]
MLQTSCRQTALPRLITSKREEVIVIKYQQKMSTFADIATCNCIDRYRISCNSVGWRRSCYKRTQGPPALQLLGWQPVWKGQAGLVVAFEGDQATNLREKSGRTEWPRRSSGCYRDSLSPSSFFAFSLSRSFTTSWQPQHLVLPGRRTSIPTNL